MGHKYFLILLLWLKCGISADCVSEIQMNVSGSTPQSCMRQSLAQTWQQCHRAKHKNAHQKHHVSICWKTRDKGQCPLLLVTVLSASRTVLAYSCRGCFNFITRVKLVPLNYFVKLIFSQIREMI